MVTRKQGSCGGTPRKDGSGRGVGNRTTNRQPAKRRIVRRTKKK